MKIEEIKDNQDFFALENEWRKIVDVSDDSSIFQTWDWNAHWWQIYGVEQKSSRQFDMMTLVAYEQNTVVGIAPLCFESIPGIPIKRLIFLGGMQSCSGDFIIVPEYRFLVLEAFIENIKSLIGILQLVELKRLYEDSSTTKWMSRRGLLGKMEPRPYLELPSTVSELNKNLGKRFRKISYYQRSLQTKHHTQLIVADSSNIQQQLGQFFYLHRKRWQTKNQTGVLAEAEYLFHQLVSPTLLDLNYLKILSLKADDQYVASICCYVYKGVMIYYLAGFNPDWKKFSPGWLIIYESMIHAIELGCKVYDFGGGKEKYKMDWYPKVSAIFNWRYARNNLLSQALLFGYSKIYEKITEDHEA